jgi:hypothetical protein
MGKGRRNRIWSQKMGRSFLSSDRFEMFVRHHWLGQVEAKFISQDYQREVRARNVSKGYNPVKDE